MRLDYPSVAAGLVDNVEQLVLHHINSSNMRLNPWMEAKVDERLTSEGQRLKIGPFVKRLSTNITLLEAGLWPEGVSAGAGLGVKNRLDIGASRPVSTSAVSG